MLFQLYVRAIPQSNKNGTRNISENGEAESWLVVRWNATNKIAERRRCKFFSCESLQKQRKSYYLSVRIKIR